MHPHPFARNIARALSLIEVVAGDVFSAGVVVWRETVCTDSGATGKWVAMCWELSGGVAN